jgi:carbonic anhydrase/acetyltransferase-like protein (isoleucine patch superfamily)
MTQIIDKKYELVKDQTIIIQDKTLYRIRALRSFSNVKEGEIGGYVQSESNLSHAGCCWIYDDAKVYDNAKVYNKARICGRSEIYDEAEIYHTALILGSVKVFHSARISSYAIIQDNVQVFGYSCVFDYAKISGNVKIFDHAQIYDSTLVSGNSQIYGSAIIYENAIISNNAVILDRAQVYGNAIVKDKAVVRKNAQVFGNAKVYDNAIVGDTNQISYSYCNFIVESNSEEEIIQNLRCQVNLPVFTEPNGKKLTLGYKFLKKSDKEDEYLSDNKNKFTLKTLFEVQSENYETFSNMDNPANDSSVLIILKCYISDIYKVENGKVYSNRFLPLYIVENNFQVPNDYAPF